MENVVIAAGEKSDFLLFFLLKKRKENKIKKS